MVERERHEGRGPGSEEKRPPIEEEVPGVRGMPDPVDLPASLPRSDLGTWGGEGGAGMYLHAPVVSGPIRPPARAPGAGWPPRGR